MAKNPLCSGVNQEDGRHRPLRGQLGRRNQDFPRDCVNWFLQLKKTQQSLPPELIPLPDSVQAFIATLGVSQSAVFN